MAFCEQCGTPLTPGSRFCEECGTEVEEVCELDKGTVCTFGEVTEIFNSLNWRNAWRQAATASKASELGLILTRENALLAQVDMSVEQLHGVLNNYIASVATRNVAYFYLNLDNFPFYDGSQSVDAVVSVLQEIVDIACPKYLFILGNEDVIDVAHWENQAADGDLEVESDLCYSTLDTLSPWNGQMYDFDVTIRVGRLPTYSGESFDSFTSYFESAAANVGQFTHLKPYGLSALEWEEESNFEFGKIASKKVDVSPHVTRATISTKVGNEANLLFFNLHGSNRTKYWYGQDGSDYPEAFSPENLMHLSRPYFLGVEACYGARYLDGVSPCDSILLTAMENQCLAFLGSSRIAFGTPMRPGSCADFVVGTYVKEIKNGASAGDAHMAGLKRLTDNWEEMDDADIKTMVEFALYGDPSACAVVQKNLNPAKGVRAFSNLTVPMPDVRKAIRLSIAEIDAKIEAIIDDYVSREVLPNLEDAIASGIVKTQTLRMQNRNLNQKIYFVQSGDINRIAKVYFDDQGNIKKTLLSK